jgi:hypothetical protein
MNMKTLLFIIRNLPTLLVALPQVFALIGKIREAFGSEKVQEAIKAFNELIGNPPVPATDGAGSNPANIKEEKRRRWFRFRNRATVAGTITDNEAWEFCAQRHIQSVDNQWT